MTPLEAALEYAGRGWRVFPLAPRSKAPLIAGGGGVYGATLDPEQIRSWWTARPDAGVGIATGAASRLAVLDVDPRNGGLESLAEFETTRGELPSTLAALTGRGDGGRHFYFSIPEGSDPIESWKPLPGLDLQADGGHYVVAPPSIHESGGAYVWMDVAPPAPILTVLIRPASNTPIPPTPAGARDNEWPAPPASASRLERWASVAMEHEIRRVAEQAPGDRNNALNRAAFALGQIVGGGGLDRARVESELYQAAFQCGLVKEDGERSVRNTILSGIEDGMRDPRVPEDRPLPGFQPVVIEGGLSTEAHGTTTADAPVTLTTTGGSAEYAPQEHMNDMGNSYRLVRHFGGVIRYVLDRERWLIWDGRRWAGASTSGKQILDLAKEVARRTLLEANVIRDEERKKKHVAWALKSGGSGHLHAMCSLAAADPRVRVQGESQLDADPWAFNVENGTLDLRTGQLRAHDPNDLMTRMAPVAFDPEAECPLWDATLLACSNDRPDWVEYVERCFGYALTGLTREQCFFVNHGRGANGKDTILLTIQGLMGEYSTVTPAGMFEEKRSDAHPTELAGLRGTRLVVASEFPEGKALNEARIKTLTGENLVAARRMHEDFSSFLPTFKVFLTCNHLPRITSADDGIRRRPRMVPWDVQFSPGQRDKDRKEKLRAEWPGILAKLVRCCLEWQDNGGLSEPESVVRATRQYLEEMDPVGKFLAECTVQCSGARITKLEMHEAYTTWAKASGAYEFTKDALGKRLKSRGLPEFRDQNERTWNHLRFLGAVEQPILDL